MYQEHDHPLQQAAGAAAVLRAGAAEPGHHAPHGGRAPAHAPRHRREARVLQPRPHVRLRGHLHLRLQADHRAQGWELSLVRRTFWYRIKMLNFIAI